MKLAKIFVVMLALGASAVMAQQSGANQPANKPGENKPSAQQPSGSAPAGQASSESQPTTPQGAPAAPAGPPPQGKQPKPKSQAEMDAYKAALALANGGDPVAMEKAANDFVVAYPDSDMAPILFRIAMRSYQAANNNDKVMEMAQKIIAADPDDPEALVDVAQIITDRVRDSDLDKDQRRAEAMKDAQHALTTVDTDLAPGMTVEQEKIFKALMKSNAYAVIGLLDYEAEKYVDAATAFQQSIDAFPQQPDPVTVLRLAYALDKQGKYADGLKAAKQAADMTQADTEVGSMARQEQGKLAKLAGGAPPK